MGSTEMLSTFWTSVLGAGFEDRLSAVMNIKDPEERIIQLLLRMLFIITLEIKKEKDDAIDSNKKLEEKFNIRLTETENKRDAIENSLKQVESSSIKKETCQTNSKKLTFGDNVQITDESDEDIIPNTEMEKVGNEIENISTMGKRRKRNRNLEYDNTQDFNKRARKDLESDNKSTESTHKNIRANRSYRSLSRASPRKNKNCDKNDKNNVLAPETQFLNENVFYFDVSSRQELATQTVSVPETMSVTQYPDAPSDTYDNTDFYDAASTIDSETQNYDIDKVIENQQKNKPDVVLHIKADALQSLESPSKQNISTPAAESQKLPSPVLGKASKGNTPNPHRTSANKITSPKKSTPSKTFTSPKGPLKQVQINTPSQALSPGNKYSPLLFKGDTNISINDSDLGSPSLFQWNNLRNLPRKKNEIENIAELAIATQPTEFCESETALIKKSSSSMRKTKSSFDASTPKISSGSIFRNKKNSVQQATTGEYEMKVEPPLSPESRKSYKQTKITAQTFAPKKTDLAKLTGGVVSKLMTNNDDSIEKAIAESLRTKEAEDMLRKKKQELNKVFEEKVESVDIQAADYKFAGPASSPKKTRKKLHSNEKLRRSPRKSQRSPQNDPISPKKIVKSPLKEKQKVPGFSVIQKDSNTKSGNPAKVKQEMCSEEQVLGPPVINKPQTKSKLKRKPQVENSFDIYSVKMDEPGYAYKNDVVRKQSDRKKMSGWSCKECERYFKTPNLTDTEQQKKMNACSRHRSKYKPTTNTPEFFWNPEMCSSDDE